MIYSSVFLNASVPSYVQSHFLPQTGNLLNTGWIIAKYVKEEMLIQNAYGEMHLIHSRLAHHPNVFQIHSSMLIKLYV